MESKHTYFHTNITNPKSPSSFLSLANVVLLVTKSFFYTREQLYAPTCMHFICEYQVISIGEYDSQPYPKT